MTPFEWIQAVSWIVTAVGVGVAAWQLYLSKMDAQAQFEDSFAEHYRQIASRLPLDALLGRPLAEADLAANLRVFYEYFDLSNEEAFFGSRRRLRGKTWSNWSEGIRQNMNREAFKQAWQRLAPYLNGSFDDLRRLLGQCPQRETAVVAGRDNPPHQLTDGKRDSCLSDRKPKE